MSIAQAGLNPFLIRATFERVQPGSLFNAALRLNPFLIRATFESEQK